MKTLNRTLMGIALVSMIGACEGPVGPKGDQGAPGNPGQMGNTGTNGTDGVNGTNGSDGEDGENGSDGIDGRDGRDAVVDPLLPPIDKAFAGIGGRDALTAMTSYRLAVNALRYASGEQYAWDDAPELGSTASATIAQDIANNGLRVEVSRNVVAFGFPVPQSFRIFVDGDLGHVEGIESLFGTPTGDMLSDGVAAMKKEQRLLNPHLILKDAIANPGSLESAGSAVLDGSLHHLLLADDPVHPITLWINAQTGRISKAVTVENEHLLRDRSIQVFYFGWEPAANGPSFPKQVVIAQDAFVLYEESRRTVEVNPTFPAGHFDLPSGSNPMFDPEAALRGAQSSQFHQNFAGFGIRLDGLQTFVAPTLVSPGVYFLAGGSHNSMAIEQQNGVVIVEPPLYEERSVALLAWAAMQFPTKPVTHIAVTHFHNDHSAGVRAFIAAGAQVVVHEASLELYEHVAKAESTIVPDGLAQNPREAQILTVPNDGSLTVDDPIRPVSFFDVENSHAADMITAYVPSGQLLFVSDLYNPGIPPFPVWPTEYYDSVVADGLDASAVTTVVGGHGGFGSFDDLRIAAGR